MRSAPRYPAARLTGLPARLIFPAILAGPASASIDAASSLAHVPRARGKLVYPVLIALLLLVSVAALLIGAGDLHDARLRETLLELRAYRVAAAFMTGASLAVAGVIIQGLFRNPLADPSLLGATAGASFGGQAAMMLYQLILAAQVGGALPAQVFLPIGCLIGALLALLALLAIARQHGDLVLLLLTGFILSSMFLGLGNFIMSMAQEKWELGRAMVAFVLGGLSGTSAAQVGMAVPLVFVSIDRSVAVGTTARRAAQRRRRIGLARRRRHGGQALVRGVERGVDRRCGFARRQRRLRRAGRAARSALAARRRAPPAGAGIGAGRWRVRDRLRRAGARDSVAHRVPLGVITGLFGAPVFLILLLRTWRGGEHG